jgi:hypothetical protein
MIATSLALYLDEDRLTKTIEARRPIMAMTTNNSINVKPLCLSE